MTSFETPELCEAAFYAAFEACDLDAMMAVWARHAPLLCVHPAGPPLTSRGAVRESWQRIFAGGGEVRFSLSNHQQVNADGLSVRFVHENIHHGPGYRNVAVVLATNVFVREDGGWRLSTHHASPGPAGSEVEAGDAVH